MLKIRGRYYQPRFAPGGRYLQMRRGQGVPQIATHRETIMKTITQALLATLISFGLLAQYTAAQDNGKPTPLEAYFCNFQDGKTMADLEKVAARFSKWADKNAPDYTAWLLTPAFAQFNQTAEVIWFGSNPSGNSMGATIESYMASGGDLQADFDKVVDCGAHALASSVPVNVPDGPPTNGVVMFTECSMAEGNDWSRALAAHKSYSQSMRDLGAKNSNWLFFPMLGGMSDRDFDYWGVSTFGSWGDYFAAYELYVNGGGWQKGMEAMQGNASCKIGSASVWNFKLVHQGEAP